MQSWILPQVDHKFFDFWPQNIYSLPVTLRLAELYLAVWLAACYKLWEVCNDRVDKCGCVCLDRTRCDVSRAIKHVVGPEAGSEAAYRLIVVTGLYARRCPGATASVLHHHRVDDVSWSQTWDLSGDFVILIPLFATTTFCSVNNAYTLHRICRVLTKGRIAFHAVIE